MVASVVSVTIHHTQVLPDGRKRINAGAVLRDNLGADSTVTLSETIFGAAVTDPEITTLLSNAALSAYARREKAEYKRDVTEGEDPFIRTAKYNDSDELEADVIRDAFANPDPLDPLTYNIAGHVQSLTDLRLQALFDRISAATITDLRARAAEILAARTSLSTYKPVILP